MTALRERALWCVNQGRVARSEWSRLRHGHIWQSAVKRAGGYIPYLLHTGGTDYNRDHYARHIEVYAGVAESEANKYARMLAYKLSKNTAGRAEHCLRIATDKAVIAVLISDAGFWAPIGLERREQQLHSRHLYTHTRARLRWRYHKAFP